MNLHHRPLFPFAIAFICGILCAAETSLHPLSVVGISAVLGALGWFIPRRILDRPVLAILLGVFLLGFLRTVVLRQVPSDDVSHLAKGQKVHMTGAVASDPEFLSGRTRFAVRSETVRTYTGTYEVAGRAMVTLYHSQGGPSDLELPSYGDRIRIHGRLRQPSAATNPGNADYGDYLARRRIYSTLTAGNDSVIILEPGAMTVRGLASRFRASLTSRSMRLFKPVNARLLLGILLGEYAALPTDVQTAFMKSGTMHLLAASGYNCGVIIGIFGYLMRRLTVPRAVMHWLLIALLWGFTLVAGAGPSIVRAALMVSAFLAAFLLRRTADLFNMVLFAGLAILWVSPLSLYDIGFQLSFAAVLAIVLGMPLVEPQSGLFSFPLRVNSAALRPLGAAFWGARTISVAVVLSVVAALATWPIVAHYFNYISIVNIVANAFSALLVVLLTAVGIGVLAVAAIWPWLGMLLSPAVDLVAGLMLGIVTYLGNLTWSSLSVRSPSQLFLFAYYLALLGILEYAHRKAARKQVLAGDRRAVPADSPDLAAGRKS